MFRISQLLALILLITCTAPALAQRSAVLTEVLQSVDVNGDGVSTPGDVIAADWWLTEFGTMGEVIFLAVAQLTDDGLYDASMLFDDAAYNRTTSPLLFTSSQPVGFSVCSFIRGDATEDGGVNIADALRISNYVVGNAPASANLDAMDANDSGSIDIADTIYLLTYLFSGGPTPSAPFPAAGTDPTADSLMPDCDLSFVDMADDLISKVHEEIANDPFMLDKIVNEFGFWDYNGDGFEDFVYVFGGREVSSVGVYEYKPHPDSAFVFDQNAPFVDDATLDDVFDTFLIKDLVGDSRPDLIYHLARGGELTMRDSDGNVTILAGFPVKEALSTQAGDLFVFGFNPTADLARVHKNNNTPQLDVLFSFPDDIVNVTTIFEYAGSAAFLAVTIDLAGQTRLFSFDLGSTAPLEVTSTESDLKDIEYVLDA